jgi:hypothetical protein
MKLEQLRSYDEQFSELYFVKQRLSRLWSILGQDGMDGPRGQAGGVEKEIK